MWGVNHPTPPKKRKELKKMTEKIIYIANDGKEFDTEEACLDYEFEQETKDFTIKIWDEGKNPMIFNSEINLEKIWYIKIEHPEQAKILDTLHYRAGLYMPFEGCYNRNLIGLWWYNDSEFINLTEITAEYQAVLDELK